MTDHLPWPPAVKQTFREVLIAGVFKQHLLVIRRFFHVVLTGFYPLKHIWPHPGPGVLQSLGDGPFTLACMHNPPPSAAVYDDTPSDLTWGDHRMFTYMLRGSDGAAIGTISCGFCEFHQKVVYFVHWINNSHDISVMHADAWTN